MRSGPFGSNLLVLVRRILVDVALLLMAFSAVTLLPLIPVLELKDMARLHYLWPQIFLYVASSTFAILALRSYRIIWRFVNFRDVLLLIKVASVTVVGFILLTALFIPLPVAPNPIFVVLVALLIWVADIGMLTIPRFISRAMGGLNLFERRSRATVSRTGAILMTGDMKRIESFIRDTLRDTDAQYLVAGILVEDSKLHGSYLSGIQILGSPQNLTAILAKLSRNNRAQDLPDKLVLAKDDATGADYQKLLHLAAGTGLKVGRLSRYDETFSSQTRAFVEPVELSDLLGRPEVTSDNRDAAAFIRGKCVLITGAGGSIGSELVRQVARLQPSKLAMLDSSEFNLYSIDHEMEENYPAMDRKALLVDVRDKDLVRFWLQKLRPEVVFHAAALKHVPMVEDHPLEGVKTNVFGTINLAEACCATGVRAMVTISTDKAVNPCNVMGATKRLAEAYCQGLDQATNRATNTRFITVRFGNVLGSAGSVVPLFQKQIEAGGPITVTHTEIKRYFMTIPEAVSLVLQAGAQGIPMDEERGNIYVLDMGEPVKIIDLARQMIRLSGQRPDIDIKIKVIGLRPGEKLYEEVAHSDEVMLNTHNKKIMRLKPRAVDLRILQKQAQEMELACAGMDDDQVIAVLRLSVPEFTVQNGLPASSNRPETATSFKKTNFPRNSTQTV